MREVSRKGEINKYQKENPHFDIVKQSSSLTDIWKNDSRMSRVDQ
jgi:hypothetical protein